MKVLHVMADASLGGGASHLMTLLPELRRQGVECTVAVGLSGPLGARLQALGFPVSPVDLLRSRFDPRAPFRLGSVLRETRANLVHLHGSRAAFFGALARSPVPIVYTVHSLAYARTGISRVRRLLALGGELIALRGATEVISVSARYLQDLERRRFVRKGCGHHIPNPLDTDRFSPGDRDAARARLGLTSDALVVGAVSRLVNGKGIEDLLFAMEQLPDAVLVVVGDGPERARLESRAGACARFLGARDDVPEILRALDVFVSASHWDSEGLALLEAMAVGLPCVATATDGASEIVGTSGAARLVPIGSPSSLAAALQTLASSEERRIELGHRARSAVRGRSPPAIAARVVAVYQRALKTGV